MKISFLLLALCCCSQLVRAAQWEVKKFQNLTYHIYLPDSEGRKGLMLSLHGCAQKAEDLEKHGNWESAADKFSTVIVLPEVPEGGVLMGCWDYAGSEQNSENKHNAILIELVNELIQESRLNIDPQRIYVSGLSSGGGEALLLGCLRPDLFAGMALVSSPAIPSQTQDISNPQTTTDQMQTFCQSLSGSHSDLLESQMASIIVSDQDFVVSPEHSRIVLSTLKILSHVQNETKLDLSTLQGQNTKGEGMLFWNPQGLPQISYIVNTGMGHNWPAGGGLMGGAFVTQNSIDYPFYVLSFFEGSNPRVPRTHAPWNP